MINDKIPKQPIQLTGTVLVTGVGFIGQSVVSELHKRTNCKIVACDINERQLSHVDARFNSVSCELADCSNEQSIQQLIDYYTPTHIINTAAFKHVRLSQTPISKATMLRNNIGIVTALSNAVRDLQYRSFVHVSTDKSVYPTTHMGYTKLLCDIKAAQIARCNIVRFGNVYGSHGSIVDLIQSGIKVQITDPNMIRHFITVNDAVEVILAAASNSTGFIYMPAHMTDATVRDVCKHNKYSTDSAARLPWVGEKITEALCWADEDWKNISSHIIRATPSRLACDFAKGNKC